MNKDKQSIESIRNLIIEKEFSLNKFEKFLAKYPEAINERNGLEIMKLKNDINYGKKIVKNYENTGIIFVDMTENQ